MTTSLETQVLINTYLFIASYVVQLLLYPSFIFTFLLYFFGIPPWPYTFFM